MANYMTPGVYVEEVPSGAKPITMVGTSTAAFLGVAPRADAPVDAPCVCVNWSQFVSLFVGSKAESTELVKAVFGFFQNGGSRCFVVNLGKGGDLSRAVAALDALDEVAIVCAPGFSDPVSHDALLSHCEQLGDRIAILDAAEDVADVELLKKVGTASTGAGVAAESSKPGLRPRSSAGGYGAFYYPHLMIRDPLVSGATVSASPSGHVAGIYARTDATRGVHKAPANEVVRGAVGLRRLVTRAEQGELNRAGVNVIRFFPDAGIRVWGARTLAEESSEWRYVNVRRLVNMIKESIENGTRWTVFEPNDMTLWKSVERNVRAFLLMLWREGALLGASPEQAFYVRCDAETNPPDVIDAGRLVTEIGIAPVKPAEFIVFRLSMWQPESDRAAT
jgi:phage tail sheath protein FI